MRAFFADVSDQLFSLDHGVPWTLGQLFRRPGPAIRSYIENRDPRMTKPLRLAVIVLAIITLAYFLVGFGDKFAASLAAKGARSSADTATSAMARALTSFFGHFDLMVLLCWVPAVGAAIQRRYPEGALNAAEAFVFGLYTLPLASIFVQPAVWLTVVGGRSYVLLALACLMWPVAHAAYGYFGAPFAAWRAFSASLLMIVCLAVMLLGALMAHVVWQILS